MKTVTVDFSKTIGPVKPMHAVNNGPVYKFAEGQRITNLDALKRPVFHMQEHTTRRFVRPTAGSTRSTSTQSFPA